MSRQARQPTEPILKTAQTLLTYSWLSDCKTFGRKTNLSFDFFVIPTNWNRRGCSQEKPWPQLTEKAQIEACSGERQSTQSLIVFSARQFSILKLLPACDLFSMTVIFLRFAQFKTCLCSCIWFCFSAKHLTVCVSCVWAGVDSAWEQYKPKARKRLVNAAESHTSAARFVRRLYERKTRWLKKHWRQDKKITPT